MIEIFYYDKGLKKGSVEILSKIKGKPLWIDITKINKEDAKVITTHFDLHPLTADDLIRDKIRVKVEEFPHYMFCVFYGISQTEKIRLFELDYIIGDNFLISNHLNEVQSYTDLKKDSERLESLLKKGVDFVFHRLLDREMDNYFPVIDKIDDHITKIEEEVTAKRPGKELMQKIIATKRTLIQVKKTSLAQREKISFLAKIEYRYISKKAIPYFRDIYDHVIRVEDSIETHIEYVGATFEIYMSAVSNELNQVMKTLSVIATIAMPLTVISSIYGTNFAHIPGAESIHGFWFMLLGMWCLSVIMVLYFKRKGWF